MAPYLSETETSLRLDRDAAWHAFPKLTKRKNSILGGRVVLPVLSTPTPTSFRPPAAPPNTNNALRGATYEEIARKGGGILFNSSRAASS